MFFNHALSMWIMCFKAQLWTKNGKCYQYKRFPTSSMHWTRVAVRTGTLIRQEVQLLKILNSSQKCRTRCYQIDRMRRRMYDHLYEQRLVQANRIRHLYRYTVNICVYIASNINNNNNIAADYSDNKNNENIFTHPSSGQYNQLYETCAIQHFESHSVLNSDRKLFMVNLNAKDQDKIGTSHEKYE